MEEEMRERRVSFRSCPCHCKPFDDDRRPVAWPKKYRPKARIMLPMSIRCNSCRIDICKGTKFNSRKEVVVGETYSGINKFRFYFKCTGCSAELAIKTDPQNSDHLVESGATRMVECEKRKEEAEEMADAMKSLQNTTSDSKREMNILAKSKDFVHMIRDEDSEDEEDLTRPCASSDEALNNALKKIKFSEEFPEKPTDSSTKATTSGISYDRGMSGNSVGSLDWSWREESCSNLQN